MKKKFMFITLSIYSKNSNSLTNFLKFFYKLKINKMFKLKFYIIQSQQQKNFSFFSVLQSPHVNKKSQEQFEYYVQKKKLKIHVSQLMKFLIVWKIIKITLFSDVKIKIKFLIYHRLFKVISSTKIDYDKFRIKFLKKKIFSCSYNSCFLSNSLSYVSLKLLDMYGEILLKNSIKGLDSSVGRAKDWKSLCRQFKPVSKHIKVFYDEYSMKHIYWIKKWSNCSKKLYTSIENKIIYSFLKYFVRWRVYFRL